MTKVNCFFAVTAPGLEALSRHELQSLGFKLVDPQNGAPNRPGKVSPPPESGGVEFEGSLIDLYRANLHLRTSSRVLVRLGDFHAENFKDLRKRASALEWASFLSPDQPVDIHTTCHKSRLYHTGAVNERIVGAIGDSLGSPPPVVKPSGLESTTQQTAQLIVVRLVHDHCTISMDSSGDLLHRRGYRLATAKAPIRETLAAAMLIAVGWDAEAPLLDPFCGSGTIAIEAALIARNIAPGSRRRFAFMDWPGFKKTKWGELCEAARQAERDSIPCIQASDRDAGAIAIAIANAERAGVAGSIEFSKRAVSAVEPPPGPGWVVTNPPYGVRVSSGKDLRDLYAQFGNVLRAKAPGWHIGVLCSDSKLLGQMKIPFDTSFSTINGGIKVRMGRGVS